MQLANGIGFVAVFSVQDGIPSFTTECDNYPELHIHYHNKNDWTGDDNEVVILGHVHDSEYSSPEKIAQDIIAAIRTDKDSFFEQLDGSFSIIAFCDRRLYLITDKLATRSLWYSCEDNKIIVSDKLINVHRRLQHNFEIDLAYLYSFTHYFRTIGGRSIFSNIKAVEAGRMLSFTPECKRNSTIYWRPIFRPNNRRSLRDVAAEFVDILSKTVNSSIDESLNPAILLSGGLDSRLVAAVCPDYVTAVTLADSHNREMAIAQQIAKVCGLVHKPIYRPTDWYPNMLERACILSDGISIWNHAHFLPLGQMNDTFPHRAVLMAFGFDTFFKGLTFRRLSITSSNPVYQHANDLLGRIINTPPELKGSRSILKDEIKRDAYESFYQAVKTKCEEIDGYSDNILDLHELFWICNFHTISEALNLTCLRGFTSERNVTFSSHMISLYLSIPLSQRNTNGAIVREALNMTNNKVSSIPNANTWLPAKWPIWAHDLSQIFRKHVAHARQSYLRIIKSNSAVSQSSWPHISRMWATNSHMQKSFDDAMDNIDPMLSHLIDMDYIIALWNRMKSNEKCECHNLNIAATIIFLLQR